MKKILFITNESSHGGAERMLIWLANQMSISGKYEVIFCNMKKAPAFYPLDEKVSFICYEKNSSENFIYRNTLGLVSKMLFIRRIIKKNKIDAVVNFNDHAIYNILMCKLFTRFKLIVSQRVDPFSIKDRTGRIRLGLLKFTDGLVCQTESALDFFNENIKKRSTVINNPVYNIPKIPWSDSQTENTIINVARIELKQKRQDVLIRAFKKVCSEIEDVKLRIFGNVAFDEDLAALKKMISDLELEDRIEYCGVTKDVISEMRKAKLMVLSSDYEGIPNAVIEAMSIGMPIVSTDCKPGGARLLLEDGSGLLTPIGDSEALADAMICFLKDRETAVSTGKKALSSVRRFDEKVIALKWIEYFESII